MNDEKNYILLAIVDEKQFVQCEDNYFLLNESSEHSPKLYSFYEASKLCEKFNKSIYAITNNIKYSIKLRS